VVDRLLARSGYESQQYDGARERGRADNLDSALPGDWGAHGEFDARARRWSSQLWFATHPRSAAAIAGVAVLCVSLARKVLR